MYKFELFVFVQTTAESVVDEYWAPNEAAVPLGEVGVPTAAYESGT